MAGHMGVDQVSQKNVEVIEVDKANDRGVPLQHGIAPWRID
jgi:ribosomal protein L3